MNYDEQGSESFAILPELSFESTTNNDNSDGDDIGQIVIAPSTLVETVSEMINNKKKRNKFTWVKEKVTNDLDEAVDDIIDQDFKLYNDHDLKKGQKFYFRCGKIPKSHKHWCDRQYIVFFAS